VRRFLTPRWLLWHAATVAAVGLFLALSWWQVRRALGGNPLSLGYAIQWPAFAGFAIVVWIRTVRHHRHAVAVSHSKGVATTLPPELRRPPPSKGAEQPEQDPALAAYNHYLAWLDTHPDRRPGDYPELINP
jgi:DNA-binding transcriptional regulator of glucitol operon